MAKKSNLLDEVLSRFSKQKRRRWIDNVPADLCEELETVKQQFRGGLMGNATANGLATLLVDSLAARGVQVHFVTLARWLKQ